MAENPTIAYLDAEGATQTATDYSFVTDSTSAVTWNTGTYVVGADYDGDGDIDVDDATYAKANDKQTEFTISDTVSLAEHAQVTLIIADGFSLSISSKDGEAGQSANAAISETATYAEMYLTVTAQSLGDDAGKLSVTGGKGGAGIAAIGTYGGNGATLTKLIVNAGNVTLSGGEGGQGGVDDDKGKDGGDGGTALYAENLIVNNGTLILHGGKGGEGGNGDEGQGKTGVTKMGAMITMYQPAINNGVLIADGGANTGAFMTLKGVITDGTNPVTMYDLNSNVLSYQDRTYKYDGAIATPLANIPPIDLVSVSSLGEQGGVTFTYDGTETTKAWAGTTVTVAGIAVEGYYIVGLTSDQVTITDNTFVMPETAVTVTATYGKYDDRIVVDKENYPQDGICTLESGKTYKAAPYEGNGGFAEVQEGGTLNTNGAGFSGNSVTRSQDDGGVIHNEGGTVNVSGGSFSSNSTQHDGGAIYNKGGTTNISGTDFTGNYTKVLGGAITTSGGVLNITSATFANNVAGSNGGAIFNSSGCVATLTDVAFSGNTAKGIYDHEGGGAIENTRGGIMTLSNVTFNGNTAQEGCGGAIFNYTLGTINLTGSVDLQTDTDTWVNEGYYNSYYKTEENSVVNWDLTQVTDPAQSTVTVKGFQYYSNKKTEVADKQQKLLVTQTITVNVTQAEGDYVLATGDFDLTTLQTNLSTDFTVKTSDESASAAITVNGDAVELGDQAYKLALVASEEAGEDQLVLTAFSYSDRIEVNTITYPEGYTLETGKTYTAKPYEGKGGAVYLDDNATLSGTDVSFVNNAATGTDGIAAAIFVYATAVISLDGDIVFSGNTAEQYAGAICGSMDASTKQGATFNFTGNSVRFINNVAKEDAGAINLSSYTTLTVDSSAEFSGNSAATEGGAIWAGVATITFNGTVDFSNNTAAGTNGGAIYSKGTVTFENTAAFTGNTAGANGGAIYNNGGTVTINGEASFSGNTATVGAGGAIYNLGTVNMANTVTLETETDTIFNEGTLNWNLTGENTGKLEGYQYLTNDSGELTLTVKAEEAKDARYVIATGSFTDTTDKDTFTLTGVNGQDDVNLSVGHNVFYNNTAYRLAVEESELVLSVVNDYTLVLKDGVAYKSTDNGETLGDTVTLEGLSYDAENSVWTMEDFTFHTAAAMAVNVQGDTAVTITVTGDNVITGGDSATTSTSGLSVFPNLNLQGSGTLTVSGGDTTGVECVSVGIGIASDLTVSGITLNVFAGKAASSSEALAYGGLLTVTDAFVTVNAGMSASGYRSIALSQTGYTPFAVNGYGKITATAAGESAYAVVVDSSPDVSAQWNGTGLVWDSTNNSYMNGSSVAANAILTKKYDERGRIVVNSGATDSLGQQGEQTIFTVAPCTNDDGGAVKNKGTFTATDVTFANNMVTKEWGCGGAIYNDRGTVTLLNSATFTGNTTVQGGGAIYSYGGTTTASVTISGNAIFTNNTVTSTSWGVGGAIQNSNNGTLTLNSATFTGNTAGKSGGAIANNGTLTLNSATFSNNSATRYGGAIQNSTDGTITLNSATFSNNSATSYGGAIQNDGTITLNSATFNGNKATGEGTYGGAIYNTRGTVSFAGTMDLQTETDTWMNKGIYSDEVRINSKVNWDLTGGTEQYGSIKNFQYYSNAATNVGTEEEPVYEYLVTQTITVNENQTKGKYVIATGDMTGYDTDETGKYTFNLTGIDGVNDVTIKVGDEKVNYGTDIFYSLYIDDKGNTDATDDELVLKVSGSLGVSVDDSMTGKWFKAGETITITGTYDGDDITSFTFGGNNVTYSEGTWSYTFTSHDDTKGTDYDIVISTADESETTTYTLQVDTVAPAVGAAAFAGDTKYVDTATGKTWFKQGDTTAALTSVITDATSGLDEVTYNGIAYDETGSKFVISTASEVEVEAQSILAADKAGNENNTVAVGAYGVDGTEPTVKNCEFTGNSKYVDSVNSKIWFKQGDTTAALTAEISDSGAGLEKALYNDFVYDAAAGKFVIDTTAEVSVEAKTITATDNVGNAVTSAAQSAYSVDGQGPTISVSHDPTTEGATSVTVTAEFADTGSGLTSGSQQYSFDGITYQDYTGSFVVTQNETLYFKAQDNVGNETIETYEITNIDTEPPVITIDADTLTLKEEMPFSVTATDSQSGVTKLEYSIDGGETWTTCSGTGKSVTADLTATVNKTTYLFRATDKGSNVSTESVTFYNIYKGTEESYEIIGEKDVIPEKPIDTEKLTLTPESKMTVEEGGTVDTDSLELTGDTSVHNNGTINAKTMTATNTENTLSGDAFTAEKITVAENAELGMSKDQYDSFIALSEFTDDSKGTLVVSQSTGNALQTDDIDRLMDKMNVTDVRFQQDLVDINKLYITSTKAATVSFCDGYGTDDSDIIRFARNTNVVFGQAGREIDLKEDCNAVQIDKNATTIIKANLTNVSKVTAAAGSTVELADVDFQDGRKASLKAKGSAFTVGNVTGPEDQCGAIAIGKGTAFTAGVMTLGAKNDEIAVGKYGAFKVTELLFGDGDDALEIGKATDADVATLDFGAGNDALKIGKATDADIATLDFGAGNDALKIGKYADVDSTSLDFGDGNDALEIGKATDADVATLDFGAGNDALKIGKYADADITSLDFGDGDDALMIGKYADVNITSLDFGEGTKDKLSIGKGAVVSVESLDVAGLDALSMGKGSLLYLGEDSYNAALATEWGQKYSAQISMLA